MERTQTGGRSRIARRLFGGLNLTWPKVIIAAVIAGVYTAAMAIIPALHSTSFITITATMEVWILFGILIIMNSKSNLDSALKCFVFFLISQPLVYLLQVPFSYMGWELFKYYPYWFIWTILCLPMGYVGYYMKKGTWWSCLILLPMIFLTAYSYLGYFSEFLFHMPGYVLISLFCAGGMILYPVVIYENKKIRVAGAVFGGVLVAVLTVICLLNPPVYSTQIMSNNDAHPFDDSYTAYLADERLGSVEIRYMDEIEDYVLQANFTHPGDTVLTMVSPAGEKREYDLHIERYTYEVVDRESPPEN